MWACASNLGLNRARACERPDHPHVECDHDDRPEGVVGDEEKVRQRAEARQYDRRYSCPRLTGEEAEAGGDEQQAKKQVTGTLLVLAMAPALLVVSVLLSLF